MSGTPRSVGVSTLERLEALVANDELFALADAVPEPDPSAGGRPRMFPPFMWICFPLLLKSREAPCHPGRSMAKAL